MKEYPTYLIHYGIEGQKWGVRRFQNEDGTWTSEGLERRKSQLIESGASKKEIRSAMREVKREKREFIKNKKYNKELAKKQEKVGKKFDKKTEKILKAREKGKYVSNRKIGKVTDLGIQFRMADYIAKDPTKYYKIKDKEKEIKKENAFWMAAAMGMAATTGWAYIRIGHIDIDKAIMTSYKNVYNEVRNETLADLKKHGVIK